MSDSKKFKVGICGGGIGGLVCALALSKYSDIDVEVFEGASSFTEVGAGIGVWPRSWQILKKLGLDNALLQISQQQPSELEVPTFKYRKSDQASGIDITTMYAKSGGLMSFYRPDFQKVLLQNLPSTCILHVKKRLVSYSISNLGIKLLFEDKTTVIVDALVGADGIKSSVRRNLLAREAHNFRQRGDTTKAKVVESSIDAIWSGIVAYRTVIPSDLLGEHYPDHPILTQPTHYLGRDTHVIAYPVSKGRLVNFAAFHARYDLLDARFESPWTSTAPKHELADLFQGWEPCVRALVECAGDPLKWAIHTVKPLHSFASSVDAVALLGDSAHGMEPFQGKTMKDERVQTVTQILGVGAGQAIEDAYTLAIVLGHPQTTKENLTQMLSVYDHLRRPFATDVARRSREAGKSFALHNEKQDFDASKLQDLKQLMETVRERWEYCWDTTLEVLDTNLEIAS